MPGPDRGIEPPPIRAGNARRSVSTCRQAAIVSGYYPAHRCDVTRESPSRKAGESITGIRRAVMNRPSGVHVPVAGAELPPGRSILAQPTTSPPHAICSRSRSKPPAGWSGKSRRWTLRPKNRRRGRRVLRCCSFPPIRCRPRRSSWIRTTRSREVRAVGAFTVDVDSQSCDPGRTVPRVHAGVVVVQSSPHHQSSTVSRPPWRRARRRRTRCRRAAHGVRAGVETPPLPIAWCSTSTSPQTIISSLVQTATWLYRGDRAPAVDIGLHALPWTDRRFRRWRDCPTDPVTSKRITTDPVRWPTGTNEMRGADAETDLRVSGLRLVSRRRSARCTPTLPPPQTIICRMPTRATLSPSAVRDDRHLGPVVDERIVAVAGISAAGSDSSQTSMGDPVHTAFEVSSLWEPS